MYVRRPAAGPTQPITLKFGLISPGLGTKPGGDPQILTSGGTPYSDPIWKTLKGKEMGGGQQTKVAPRGGFVHKNFNCGGLTPTQSPKGT